MGETSSPDRSLATGPQWGTSDPPAPLAALSGNEFFASVYGCVLVTTSAARQTHGRPGTRGTDSWLDDTDNNFGPDLPLLLKMHEIWSVDLRKIVKLLPPDVRFKVKMHQIRFLLGRPLSRIFQKIRLAEPYFRLISGSAEFLRLKMRPNTTNSAKTDKLRQSNSKYKQHNKGV